MNRGYSNLTGATFVPGGEDSYYMPELVSPAPQRVLSELPTNISSNLAEFEQQAQARVPAPPPNNEPYSKTQYGNGQDNYTYSQNVQSGQNWSPPNNIPIQQQPPTQYQQPPPPQPQPQYQAQDRYGSSTSAPLYEAPNFSPFPVLRNPGPNVPPTDEHKEATLEAAREAVLASNDPETQLIWAQDALVYVEAAIQNEQRISATQPPRSRTPRVEHMLREDAMKVVDFLADQRHPKAEFLRGMWLEFGKFGRRIDKKEAFHCYTRASEKGYARADYRIGMQFETSNDALKAIKYYQKGVDAGDSASCYRLGMMTLLGQHGQAQDYERGLNLIYSAATTADENAPQGAYVFGMLQARQLAQVSIPERFLPLDTSGARMNIEKAAYLGFAKAQVKMGSAYELRELGCEFDPALSLHYNALAARQGEADAEMAISKWFLCGHEGLFEKNEEMAFTYAQRAAVGGLATAQFAMGYFYEVGIYVPVNFREAKEWYQRASAGGNKDASTRIDCISRSKTLSRKDHERVAVSKIRQSHAQNQSRLATMAEVPETPTITMPDPSKLSLNPQDGPTSTAPYPEDEGPPRPGLYPQSSNYSNPERPTSAFGINPNLRPNSAATMPASRPDPYNQPGYPPQNRPPPSQNPSGPGYGRGYRPNPQPGARLSPRLSPAPGPIPQGRGQQWPGSTPPYQNPQSGQGAPPPRPGKVPQPGPPKVDLGFSAPPDPQGADRKRLPGADEFMTRRQQQQPQQPPNGQQRPYDKPMPPRPNNQNGNIQPARIIPSKASNLPAGPISPSKPSKVSANTKPPKKGPQTFQEMGVPAGKGEGDCVVM